MSGHGHLVFRTIGHSSYEGRTNGHSKGRTDRDPMCPENTQERRRCDIYSNNLLDVGSREIGGKTSHLQHLPPIESDSIDRPKELLSISKSSPWSRGCNTPWQRMSANRKTKGAAGQG
jgi:hypothetical protein